jgi:hypothetical protein
MRDSAPAPLRRARLDYSRRPLPIRIAMTRLARVLLALFLVVAAASASAATVVTLGGQFELPDGFRPLDRKDDADSGLYVFGRTADAQPRAVYIVTIVRVANPDVGSTPSDVRETAVRIANPMDPTLPAGAAEAVTIGGEPGARYATTLPDGLLSTGVAADHGDLRLVALLKSPSGRAYREDNARFAAALEAFVWTPATPAPAD